MKHRRLAATEATGMLAANDPALANDDPIWTGVHVHRPTAVASTEHLLVSMHTEQIFGADAGTPWKPWKPSKLPGIPPFGDQDCTPKHRLGAGPRHGAGHRRGLHSNDHVRSRHGRGDGGASSEAGR